MPDGLTDIDSWIEPTFERCFQLMECDDARLLQQWIVHWLGVTPQMAARFRAYHEVAGHGADFCAIRPPPSRRGSPAEEIAQSTVAKYMIKRPRRPGQGWTTFLRNHADGIAAADLFVVPTIGFKLLYGLVILGHGRRRLIHHAVTTHPTAEWIAQQIVEAFPWDQAPEYLVRDRDAVYGEVVKRRLRGLGIRDRPTAPCSPKQNAHVERLIGSIRRECIDHAIVLGEAHLRRIMSRYARYYNESRTHLALRKDAPVSRSIELLGRVIAHPVVGGLHHRYPRI